MNNHDKIISVGLPIDGLTEAGFDLDQPFQSHLIQDEIVKFTQDDKVLYVKDGEKGK
jgi:hypothetical protein